MENNKMHLLHIIEKYKARNLEDYNFEISKLKMRLATWAGSNDSINIHESGSRAKGTAISISSDVDYFLSLSGNHHSTLLSDTYESLYTELKKYYSAKKQN